MPYVACPACGERGKIPPTLVGARIKCKKCGISFNVAPAAAKAHVAAGAQAMPGDGAEAALGIAVEGLDVDAWAVTGDHSADPLKIDMQPEHAISEGHETSHAFEAHGVPALREYKIICSRDKVFEGKFELARLEELINQHAHQGWVVRAMSTPHLKGFGEGTKEEIVVLLER